MSMGHLTVPENKKISKTNKVNKKEQALTGLAHWIDKSCLASYKAIIGNLYFLFTAKNIVNPVCYQIFFR